MRRHCIISLCTAAISFVQDIARERQRKRKGERGSGEGWGVRGDILHMP